MAPKKAPPSSDGKQTTLLGFFSKTPSSGLPSSSPSQPSRRLPSASRSLSSVPSSSNTTPAAKVVPSKNKASPPSQSLPTKRPRTEDAAPSSSLEPVLESDQDEGSEGAADQTIVQVDADVDEDEDEYPIVQVRSLLIAKYKTYNSVRRSARHPRLEDVVGYMRSCNKHLTSSL